MMIFSGLDIIAVSILGIFVLVSFVRGPIQSILALAGLIVSIYITLSYGDLKFLHIPWFQDFPKYLVFVSFITVFFITLIILTCVRYFLGIFCKWIRLGLIGWGITATCGILHGAGYIIFLAAILSTTPLKQKIYTSKIYHIFSTSREYQYFATKVSDKFLDISTPQEKL